METPIEVQVHYRDGKGLGLDELRELRDDCQEAIAYLYKSLYRPEEILARDVNIEFFEVHELSCNVPDVWAVIILGSGTPIENIGEHTADHFLRRCGIKRMATKLVIDSGIIIKMGGSQTPMYWDHHGQYMGHIYRDRDSI